MVVYVGDVFRIMGTGDFLNTGGMGQLVQVEEVYHEGNYEFVRFKYFNKAGSPVTCIITANPNNGVPVVHGLKGLLDAGTARVDVAPKVRTKLSGRKIWYQFDRYHVTPKPKGLFPMFPGITYAGRNFIGKWVYIEGVDELQDAFGLALPFHLKAPSGSGCEEHGPPVIKLSKIALMYKRIASGDKWGSNMGFNLWGRPVAYTTLSVVPEADIGMIMKELRMDPEEVIPVVFSEYQRLKENTNQIV